MNRRDLTLLDNRLVFHILKSELFGGLYFRKLLFRATLDLNRSFLDWKASLWIKGTLVVY